MNDYLQIGEIVNTHGVRGDVKVYPYTDDITRFSELSSLLIERPGKDREQVKITGAKYFKNMVILHLKGVESMNDAEKLRGSRLFVERADAAPLGENEYYIADLIGLSVVTDEGETLGELKDVLVTGANDVYLVRDRDYKNNKKEYLLPAIKDCILNVDLEKGVVLVHLMGEI